jgi:hypothetical protein
MEKNYSLLTPAPTERKARGINPKFEIRNPEKVMEMT